MNSFVIRSFEMLCDANPQNAKDMPAMKISIRNLERRGQRKTLMPVGCMHLLQHSGRRNQISYLIERRPSLRV